MVGWFGLGGVSFQSARGLAQSKALRAAEVVAEFGGGWGIAKKVFFVARKNMIFLQVLKMGKKCSFRPTKSGVVSVPRFLISSEFGSKTGSKKISCQTYHRLQIGKLFVVEWRPL